jgi:hypothetical protein
VGDRDTAKQSGMRGLNEDSEARAVSEVERGMAEMSERYRDGGDLYVPAE